MLLAGQSVTVKNATDTADATSVSKSSSFGFSLKLYENVSGAAKSVPGLPGRVGANGAGTAGTAITAVSETLRTVSAVTKAFTNTAGVSASLGFSKSKSESASQETAAVGSTVTGANVAIRAAEDVRVTGSSVNAVHDATFVAGRDAIFDSAQNTLATQTKSKSSGASIGVSVGFGIVGRVNASASIGVSSSRSSGQSSEVAQVNTAVTAGGTLALTTGRDAMLKGAVVQGKTVVAHIGRDLAIQSVQDSASHSSNSAGFSAGVSFSPSGAGVNGSVSAGNGSGSSAIVVEQSALLARGGSLDATVAGNTDLKGGVIAALDAAGRDSGKLTLTTGSLSASDIADSARSKDVGIGVSVSVNDPFRQGVKGANTPAVAGHYAMSDFRQETKATIGQGQVSIAVPAANVTINRDLNQSQVVTKDSATGFSVYLDEAAIRETVALLKGDRANSTILKGADALANDPLKLARDVVAEINSLSDSRPNSGALDTLLGKANRLLVEDQRANEREGHTIASDPRFTGKTADEVGAIRGADAVAQVRARYGDEAAAAYAAVLQTPEGQAQLRAVGLITLAYRDKGGNLETLKDGLIPAEFRPEGSSGASGPGDTTIDGHAPTFGDKTVSVLAGAGKLINKVPPDVQEAASFGTSLLLGGPVAAVGGYFISKAVEYGIKHSPDAQAAIKEAGLQSVDLLSSSRPDRNREDAEDRGYVESSNLLTAAGTLLNIGTLKKLVGKAGGLLSGAETAKPNVTVEEPGLSGADITFGKGINLQGKAFEDALEDSGQFGMRLHTNSKTFDFFDPATGTATSAKTLELLTDPRLRNPNQIYSTLTRYIDQAVDYSGSNKLIDLKAWEIQSKALVIAVEDGGSQAQLRQIQRAIDYAKARGLPVQVITVGGKGQ